MRSIRLQRNVKSSRYADTETKALVFELHSLISDTSLCLSVCLSVRLSKVETVGDCYVAASGLPLPNKNHAVTMSLFATDCLKAMPLLVSQLETTLGPDVSLCFFDVFFSNFFCWSLATSCDRSNT